MGPQARPTGIRYRQITVRTDNVEEPHTVNGRSGVRSEERGVRSEE